jgi:hypothetical protein
MMPDEFAAGGAGDQQGASPMEDLGDEENL